MLKVEGLGKQFGTARVLDNITFQAKQGEILGFLGPNGAGKTTTMRIITGFLSPTSGTVRVGNHDIMNDSLAARRKIGYLPESNPLYGDFLVYEALDFVAHTKGVLPRGKAYREVLDICGLREVLAQPIQQLSKGYRQRVGLAQALLGQPDILILDEPTSGLDPNQIKEVREVIKRIGQSKTIIFSTHILSEVSATCDRVIIINGGRIIAQGTVAELTDQGRGGETVKVLLEGSLGALRDGLAKIDPGLKILSHHEEEGAHRFVLGSGTSADLRRRIFEAAKNNHWTLLEMTRDKQNLEEVFQKLTQKK